MINSYLIEIFNAHNRCFRVVFRSKYDKFWTSIFNDIHNALIKVDKKGLVILSIKKIKQFSSLRTNWTDKMIICGNKVFLEPKYPPLRSLLKILFERENINKYKDCVMFKITSNLELVIKKINYYESLKYISMKESILATSLIKYSKFRSFPLGRKCICDKIFSNYKWRELVLLSPTDLPSSPGIYVIRIIEPGKDLRNVSYNLIENLAKTKWRELIKYAYYRIRKLEYISNCPIIYIDHSVNLKNRYRDIIYLKHSLSIVFLGMTMYGWRLDFGFVTIGKTKLLKNYEEIINKYIEIHGDLPAFNK